MSKNYGKQAPAATKPTDKPECDRDGVKIAVKIATASVRKVVSEGEDGR